ncbi:MAG: hypothetical protein QXU20_03575 [Candidatus Woesearchaeota archaeon]
MQKTELEIAIIVLLLFSAGILSLFLIKPSIVGFIISTTNVIDVPPNKTILYYPENNSLVFDNPLFLKWYKTIELNNDPVIYDLLLANDSDFNTTLINETGIEGINESNGTIISYEITIPLEKKYYYWKARAFDGNFYGEFSDVWNFKYCYGNNAPIIEPIGAQSVKYGEYFYYKVTFSDPDNDPLNITDNTELFDITQDGIISFIATSKPGSYVITILVNDGCNITHDIFTLTILPREEEQPPSGGAGGGGGGGAGGAITGPSVQVYYPQPKREEKKENISEEVKEILTEEEKRFFNKIKMIYLGDLDITPKIYFEMYEGPVWFFTYYKKNYFMTYTKISNSSFYIAFLDGPGILFRKPSSTTLNIDEDPLDDILIQFYNLTLENASMSIEAIKKKEVEKPRLIITAAAFRIGFLIIFIILGVLLLLLLLKLLLRKKGLKFYKRIAKIQEDVYEVRIVLENYLKTTMEEITIQDSYPKDAETSEIKVFSESKKEIREEIFDEKNTKVVRWYVNDLKVGEKLMFYYALKTKKSIFSLRSMRAELSYKIKILDSYLNFVKKSS